MLLSAVLATNLVLQPSTPTSITPRNTSPAATAPETQPSTPHFTQVRSGVLDINWRIRKDAGIALHLVRNEKHYLIIAYTLSDGVPIFISDGNRVLAFDALGQRLIYDDTAKSVVSFLWTENPAIPYYLLVSVAGWTFTNNPSVEVSYRPAALNVSGPSFYRLPNASASDAEQIRLSKRRVATLQRRGPFVDTLIIDELDRSRFALSSLTGDGARLDLEAQSMNKDVPDESLAFPDIDKLSTQIPIVTRPAEISSKDRKAAFNPVALKIGLEITPFLPNGKIEESRLSREARGTMDRNRFLALSEQLARQYLPALAEQNIAPMPAFLVRTPTTQPTP